MRDNPNAKLLGARLRALRLARGLTIREVVLRSAEKGKFPPFTEGALQKWESGQHEPRASDVRSLSEALDVEEADITSAFDPKAPEPELLLQARDLAEKQAAEETETERILAEERTAKLARRA